MRGNQNLQLLSDRGDNSHPTPGDRGSTMRVSGEFMEFGSSFVRVIWHSFSHPQ